MNRDHWRVQQKVDAAWQAVVSGMQTMYPASVVRPAQLAEVQVAIRNGTGQQV